MAFSFFHRKPSNRADASRSYHNNNYNAPYDSDATANTSTSAAGVRRKKSFKLFKKFRSRQRHEPVEHGVPFPAVADERLIRSSVRDIVYPRPSLPQPLVGTSRQRHTRRERSHSHSRVPESTYSVDRTNYTRRPRVSEASYSVESNQTHYSRRPSLRQPEEPLYGVENSHYQRHAHRHYNSRPTASPAVYPPRISPSASGSPSPGYTAFARPPHRTVVYDIYGRPREIVLDPDAIPPPAYSPFASNTPTMYTFLL